jgi:DNA/RNA-binding domain of Phe-tRNA-synthetase-like protein
MPDTIFIAPELEGAARIGILQMDKLRVAESPPELKRMLEQLAEEYAAKYRDQPLGEIPTVRKVRAIFHRAGLDPTRYRPSSESLLRRAVKGKDMGGANASPVGRSHPRRGLYWINSVVDLVNYYSLKTLWPMGLYDADRLKPPITFRIGRDGESYEGIGRDKLNLAHFPLLVDQEGPFGSPVSDSMRTRVTEACTRILWITFAPPGTAIPNAEFAASMTRFNGGVVMVSKEL